MRKTYWTRVGLGILAALLTVSTVQAREKLSRSPQRFLAETDGKMALAVDAATQTEWAVWSYRNGGQYDVAIVRRSLAVDAGIDAEWTEPAFIGADDGLSQVQPSLAADPAGNLYLAYAQAGQVILTTRPAGSSAWTAPVSVAPGRRVTSPLVKVVGDRLIVAYRHGAEIELHDVPLLQEVFRGSTIHDAPDPILSAPTGEGRKGGGDGSGQDSGEGQADGPVDLDHDNSSSEDQGNQLG